ncbi:hypothetical protein [Sinorhizobium meliloti]|uniref:hypothetical protein n=1 Tax=Rhizobium meliloti TaxID=382 RepID=UPI0013148889|nr:hypothetical protein [Sinorhizobium meliloti]MDE4615945.1 hypothetical protein [Sinorhizobium meliloti]
MTPEIQYAPIQCQIPGEHFWGSGAYRNLVYARGPLDNRKPTIVFLAGAGHLGRVAYGYPGCDPRNFLDHWLKELGFGFLVLSPAPEGNDGTQLSRSGWAKVAAEQIGCKFHSSTTFSTTLAIAAWSMGCGLVGPLSGYLQAQRFVVQGFIPLAGSAPLPKPSGNYITEEIVDPNGMWDVADSQVFGVQRLTVWREELTEIANDCSGSPITLEGYERHILCKTPAGLMSRSPNPIERDAPDIGLQSFPLAAPVSPSRKVDFRHVLTDFSGWHYVNTQNLLGWYINCKKYPIDGDALWRDVSGVMFKSLASLQATIRGGHLFFVGERGAQETALALAQLLDDITLITAKQRLWSDACESNSSAEIAPNDAKIGSRVCVDLEKYSIQRQTERN